MPATIELTLASLLPTVSYFPPELLLLCASLIAQSQSKASTLKPEEEIGRTYACCHIACQRLGHRLGLEIAKPAPPVKPKVYNKLHTYLNAVLKTTWNPRPPTTNRTEDKQTKPKPTRATNPQPAPTVPPLPSKKRPHTSIPSQTHANALPPSTHPLIRHACQSADAEEAIPHVFAGLSSILSHLNYSASSTPQRTAKRRKLETAGAPEDISATHIPSLIIALVLAVMGRMWGEEYVDDREVVGGVGEGMRALVAGTEFEGWGFEFDEKELLENVRCWKSAIKGEWGEWEWWGNVPKCVSALLEDAKRMLEEAGEWDGKEKNGGRGAKGGRGVSTAKTPLRRREKRGEDVVGAAGLLPGLGTMFQPAVDWLSEETRENYVRWRREALRDGVVLA